MGFYFHTRSKLSLIESYCSFVLLPTACQEHVISRITLSINYKSFYKTELTEKI